MRLSYDSFVDDLVGPCGTMQVSATLNAHDVGRGSPSDQWKDVGDVQEMKESNYST